MPAENMTVSLTDKHEVEDGMDLARCASYGVTLAGGCLLNAAISS